MSGFIVVQKYVGFIMMFPNAPSHVCIFSGWIIEYANSMLGCVDCKESSGCSTNMKTSRKCKYWRSHDNTSAVWLPFWTKSCDSSPKMPNSGVFLLWVFAHSHRGQEAQQGAAMPVKSFRYMRTQCARPPYVIWCDENWKWPKLWSYVLPSSYLIHCFENWKWSSYNHRLSAASTDPVELGEYCRLTWSTSCKLPLVANVLFEMGPKWLS